MGTILSSCITTISPSCTYLEGWFHLANRRRLFKYSFDHLVQKWRMTPGHRCHRRRVEIESSGEETSGNASIGRPIRKCPGVNASIPSSSHVMSTSGRLFRHASIWDKMVISSSKVNLTLLVTRFKWVFRLLTAASHIPPKRGECQD